MRFTLIKDLSKDTSMRPILTGLLIFTLIYILTDFIVKYFNFGVFPQAISLSLFGDEEQFIDPLSQASFLEFWHMEIFFMMMLLLTLSAVFIRLAKNNNSKLLILNILMASAILSLITLFLAYYVSSIFVVGYSILYILWHLTAIYMIIYSLWKLSL